MYSAGGDHDLMVGGHATPTGYKTKGALRGVEVHVSVNFLCLAGFGGYLFNTVEVVCSRVLGVSCGYSYLVVDEVYIGFF